MQLTSIASSFPRHRFTQREAYEGLSQTRSFAKLRSGSRLLLGRLLLKPGAIETRHFCTDDLPSLVDRDAGELNRLFESEGRQLASDALEAALGKAGLKPNELDALVLCTCTGYLCPGLSSHVAEQLGLREDIYLQDIVGLGCGAAIPALRAVQGLCRTQSGARVGLIAVELSSAAFYMDDDAGVLISLSLFGDGASASVWQAAEDDNAWQCDHFQTLHRPQHRDLLRFENDCGFLRNRLGREVPTLAAEAVSQLHRAAGIGPGEVIAHGGGKDVVAALQEVLDGEALAETCSVLSDYGNLSSPSVMIALERRLESPEADQQQRLWLTSFGAGFAAHACQLTRGKRD